MTREQWTQPAAGEQFSAAEGARMRERAAKNGREQKEAGVTS